MVRATEPLLKIKAYTAPQYAHSDIRAAVVEAGVVLASPQAPLRHVIETRKFSRPALETCQLR